MKIKIQQTERFDDIDDLNSFLENEGSNIISVTPLGAAHVIFIVLYWKSIDL
jgi:hypothetical protein